MIGIRACAFAGPWVSTRHCRAGQSQPNGHGLERCHDVQIRSQSSKGKRSILRLAAQTAFGLKSSLLMRHPTWGACKAIVTSIEFYSTKASSILFQCKQLIWRVYTVCTYLTVVSDCRSLSVVIAARQGSLRLPDGNGICNA